MDSVYLYIVILSQGEFGPFDPMLTVFIPLWLAVTLRKKEKCRIVIPDWLLLGMYVPGE
jgi:GINS complex subunit 2